MLARNLLPVRRSARCPINLDCYGMARSMRYDVYLSAVETQ